MSHDSTVRADGPVMVVKGPDHGPLVVVLDPSGDAKHHELPATWRPLTDDVGVVWWRLPSARRTGQTGERLLADLPGNHDRVYLVGVDDAALLTLSLAIGRRDLVRSIVLVDPPWPEHDLGAVGQIANDPELTVQQVRTNGDVTDTLPIGHPEVVRAVVQALVSADVQPATAPVRAGVEPLALKAWRALRTKLMRLLEPRNGNGEK